MNNVEKQTFSIAANLCKFEIKEKFDSKSNDAEVFPQGIPPLEEMPILTGYAATWGATSEDSRAFDGPNSKRYFARFSKEGFNAAPTMLALYGHDTNMPLGRTDNSTLQFQADDYGLKVSFRPPNTSYGRDAVELVKGQYVSGMSFGMFPAQWNDSSENGKNIRTFTKYLVNEVSLTADPSFESTSIGVQLSKELTPIRDRFSIELEEYRLWMMNINS